MAKKKKYVFKDIKKPDEFQFLMTKFLEFLKVYGIWIVGGIFAILIIILSLTLIHRYQVKKSVEVASIFDNAINPLLIEEPKNEGEGKKLDENKEKKSMEEAKKSFESFVREYSSHPLSDLGNLILAMFYLKEGSFNNSLQLYSKYIEKNPNSPIKVLVYETMGCLSDKLKNKDKAVSYFERMAEIGDSHLRARALMDAGDIFNPSLSKTNPDSIKAREYYEKGLKEMGGEDTLLTYFDLSLKKMLESRLATLPPPSSNKEKTKEKK